MDEKKKLLGTIDHLKFTVEEFRRELQKRDRLIAILEKALDAKTKSKKL